MKALLARARTIISKKGLLQLTGLLLVTGICVLIFIYRQHIEKYGNYGYAGAFIVSLLANATIVVPLPGWVITISLGSALNPLWVGMVMGIGGSIGEITGYLFGVGSRVAIEKHKTYQRVAGWVKRWGGITIFMLALIPNPIFDLAGIAAGALKVPLWKFMLYTAAGKIPKFIMIAYFGQWGLGFLLKYMT